MTAAMEDPLASFRALPGRVFLDSSVLQWLLVYGEFVFENVEPPPEARVHRMPDGMDELEALRSICFVARRAAFEFALSGASLEEVAAAARVPGYLGWAYEMLYYWEDLLAGYDGDAFTGSGRVLAPALDGPAFGYLGRKDRRLVRDAVELECDAFLTMERRLPKNAAHIERVVGIRVLRPSQWWAQLERWARLCV